MWRIHTSKAGSPLTTDSIHSLPQDRGVRSVMCSLLKRAEWKPCHECSLTPSWQAPGVWGKIGKKWLRGEVKLSHLHPPSHPPQIKPPSCTSWCWLSGVLMGAAWPEGGRSLLCWKLPKLGLYRVWGADKTATFRFTSSEHEPFQLFQTSSRGGMQLCPSTQGIKHRRADEAESLSALGFI